MLYLTGDMLRTGRLIVSPGWVSNGFWCLPRSMVDPNQNACLDDPRMATALFNALAVGEDCRCEHEDCWLEHVVKTDDEIETALALDATDVFTNTETCVCHVRAQTHPAEIWTCGKSVVLVSHSLRLSVCAEDETAIGRASVGYSKTPLRFADGQVIMCTCAPLPGSIEALRALCNAVGGK